MDDTTPIPGFSEISHWPTPIELPLSLKTHGFYRDPNPHCTHHFEIADGEGRIFPFFFERFLGRLCYGLTDETADDAAFVTSGSDLAKDVFAVLTAALNDKTTHDIIRLRDAVDRGRHWSLR